MSSQWSVISSQQPNGGQQSARTRAMKVTYDQQTDSLTITLRDERIKESDEVLSDPVGQCPKFTRGGKGSCTVWLTKPSKT